MAVHTGNDDDEVYQEVSEGSRQVSGYLSAQEELASRASTGREEFESCSEAAGGDTEEVDQEAFTPPPGAGPQRQAISGVTAGVQRAARCDQQFLWAQG